MVTRGVARNEVLSRVQISLMAALAYFGVERGMAIAARDEEGFEFAYADGLDPRFCEEAAAAGRELFTRVRLKPFDLSTLPRDGEEQAAEAVRLAHLLGWQG